MSDDDAQPVWRTKSLAVVLLAGLLIAAAVWWFQRSPVALNDNQYATAIALYRVCNQRSETGLDKIEAILASPDSPRQASDKSLAAIQAIISEARRGNWQQATRRCRTLLEDQVQR
jgi:hypothetical protein